MSERFRTCTLAAATLLAVAGALALAGATPGLAAYAPATGSATPAGVAAEAPLLPTTSEPRTQESDEPQQFAERDTSSDNAWIIIAVVLLVVVTALGVGLAAMGLSAE